MPPSAAEQGVLWGGFALFTAGSVVLLLIAYILNWKVSSNMGKSVVANLPFKDLFGVDVRKNLAKWIDRWHDPERRVRRFATIWFAMAALALAFFSGMIALVLGTFLRDDGKESEWQRWVSFVIAFTFGTIGMSEYYAVPLTDTLVWLIPCSVLAMGPGFATSYLPGDSRGWAYFGTFGMVGLLAVFLVLILRTEYNLYPKIYRGAPALLHILFPFVWWIILWAGPETNGRDTTGHRTSAAIAYLVFEILWLVSDLLFLYLFRLGDSRVGTRATDSIRVPMKQNPETGEWEPEDIEEAGRKGRRGKAYSPQNTDPDSPFYDGGATPVPKPGKKPRQPVVRTVKTRYGVH